MAVGVLMKRAFEKSMGLPCRKSHLEREVGHDARISLQFHYGFRQAAVLFVKSKRPDLAVDFNYHGYLLLEGQKPGANAMNATSQPKVA
jgi:hypothetical protein